MTTIIAASPQKAVKKSKSEKSMQRERPPKERKQLNVNWFSPEMGGTLRRNLQKPTQPLGGKTNKKKSKPKEEVAAESDNLPRHKTVKPASTKK